MRSFIIPLAAATLLCGGCIPRYGDTTLYTVSGRQKPIIAVLPVIDTTGQNQLKWDVSEELTDGIRKKVYESQNVYLLRDTGNLELAQKLATPNPKAIPSAALQNLGAAEFVVVAEIIEQDESAYCSNHPQGDNACSDVGSILTTALRVRILDVRNKQPKLVLQEVMDHEYVASRAYMNCNYDKIHWGTEAYSRTPMGMAHSRLIKQLVARIEAYIEAA